MKCGVGSQFRLKLMLWSVFSLCAITVVIADTNEQPDGLLPEYNNGEILLPSDQPVKPEEQKPVESGKQNESGNNGIVEELKTPVLLITDNQDINRKLTAAVYNKVKEIREQKEQDIQSSKPEELPIVSEKVKPEASQQTLPEEVVPEHILSEKLNKEPEVLPDQTSSEQTPSDQAPTENLLSEDERIDQLFGKHHGQGMQEASKPTPEQIVNAVAVQQEMIEVQPDQRSWWQRMTNGINRLLGGKNNEKTCTVEGLVGNFSIGVGRLIEVLRSGKFPSRFLNRAIFHGPPGNGKTTLAKRMSEIAGWEFIEVSAPTLVTQYQGSGPENVKKYFDDAVEKAKAGIRTIIFFDEIDAIASPRHADENNREYSSATQALWLWLDIIRNDEYLLKHVFVVFATNEFSRLHKTLVDRFGTNVFEIGYPDLETRKALWKQCFDKYNVQFSQNSMYEELASLTDGLSMRAISDTVDSIMADHDMAQRRNGNQTNTIISLDQIKDRLSLRKDLARESIVEKVKDSIDTNADRLIKLGHIVTAAEIVAGAAATAGITTYVYHKAMSMLPAKEEEKVVQQPIIITVQPSEKTRTEKAIAWVKKQLPWTTPEVEKIEIQGMAGKYPKQVAAIIEQLKDPKARVGLNRLILYGPPGTGKSMLAKQMAKLANCEFIEFSGASAVNKYQGSGAEAIKNIFEEMRIRNKATGKRVVLDIEEVDGFVADYGSKGSDNGRDHLAATQELWLNLDKIKNDSRFFVVCTTNKMKELHATFKDRFGQNIVEIPMPDAAMRKEVVDYHLRDQGIQLNDHIKQEIIDRTDGLSNRKISDIVGSVANEAVINKGKGKALRIDEIYEIIEQSRRATDKTVKDYAKEYSEEYHAFAELATAAQGAKMLGQIALGVPATAVGIYETLFYFGGGQLPSWLGMVKALKGHLGL
jgi:SpoVK/Ycf46/Vps4 family AAA+-type ATPase